IRAVGLGYDAYAAVYRAGYALHHPGGADLRREDEAGRHRVATPLCGGRVSFIEYARYRTAGHPGVALWGSHRGFNDSIGPAYKTTPGRIRRPNATGPGCLLDNGMVLTYERFYLTAPGGSP